MQTDPVQSDPVPADLTNFDHSSDAIDIQQWQMEIDNFIDETSTELNEIANILDGGPIREPATDNMTEDREDSQPNTAVNPDSESRTASVPGSSSVNHSSYDRLASLKQKLASQIKENRDPE